MNQTQFNDFCGSLRAASHGVQWGGADVWKVGPWATGKVFAIGGADGDGLYRMSFKVSEIGWEVLREAPGCRPAPYLASRGMKWIQADGKGGPKLKELRGYLEQSHAIVGAGLSKKRQAELGL
jgi:predicted DNA-binding protein (MmcQ/YjbR family)